MAIENVVPTVGMRSECHMLASVHNEEEGEGDEDDDDNDYGDEKRINAMSNSLTFVCTVGPVCPSVPVSSVPSIPVLFAACVLCACCWNGKKGAAWVCYAFLTAAALRFLAWHNNGGCPPVPSRSSLSFVWFA